MRILMLTAVVVLTMTAISCNRDEEPDPLSVPEMLMLGKWNFPEDSASLWSGRTMTLKTKPSPTITVDSVPVMRWTPNGNQITAMREDSNRVWKFQFKILDLNDTSMTIEGGYGYSINVNGSQWSDAGIDTRIWNISGVLTRDSTDYMIWDE